MDIVNFREMSEFNISQSIHQLIQEGSILKKNIFQKELLKMSSDSNAMDKFKLKVNQFLKMWTDYSIDLIRVMRSISLNEDYSNIKTIPYSQVKEYLYATNDYSSVLQFLDGIIRGIRDNKITKVSDIDDFKDHTLRMAFGNNYTTVNGLLDSVLPTQSPTDIATPMDIKMFDAIKDYPNLFYPGDRIELYKSIDHSLNFLKNDDIPLIGTKYDIAKMSIEIISSTIDYMIFSLTVYACRIYMISRYAAPFIEIATRNTNEVTESTHQTYGEEILASLTIGIEEVIIKDPKRSNEFFDRTKDLMESVGITDFFKNIANRYVPIKMLENNIFTKALKDNPICEIFRGLIDVGCNDESSIVEFHTNIKTFLFNPHQGLGNCQSPKQEFMNIIRDTKYGDSVQDDKKLLEDLYAFCLEMNLKCQGKMNYIDSSWEDEINFKNKLPIASRKLLAETNKFLISWYEEFMFAFAQKIVYHIESIKEKNEKSVNEIMGLASIKLPAIPSDSDLMNKTTLSIPATIRTVLTKDNDIDLYAISAFESMEMYEDYLRSLPEFKDDWYLSETGPISISTIMNAIRTAIQALIKKITDFVKGNSFKQAQKWVIDNESTILGLEFPADTTMEVLPYTKDIDVSKRFNNRAFISGIQNLNIDEFRKDIDKSIEKIYQDSCDTQTFNIFKNFPPETSKIRYKNLLLYGVESDQEVTKKSINSREIKDNLRSWVELVKSADDVMNSFKTVSDKINTAANSLNGKAVNANNQDNRTQTSTQNQNTTNQTNDSNAGKSNTTQNQNTNTSDATNGVGEVLTKVQGVINNLWVPIPDLILRTTMDQYNYIKQAYNVANNRQGNTGTTQSNQTSTNSF